MPFHIDLTERPQTPPQPSRAPLIVLLGIVAAVVAFIGVFHVVQSDSGVIFIPKEHFSFSLSFTSVDEVLKRHNGSGPFLHDPLLDHLVSELDHRGRIYFPAQREFRQNHPQTKSSETSASNVPSESSASNVPSDCYFNTPGDVSVVTDGNDYRLRLAGGYVGNEVFATKQEAIDYIYKMHKIIHPTEGKNYQPAP